MRPLGTSALLHNRPPARSRRRLPRRTLGCLGNPWRTRTAPVWPRICGRRTLAQSYSPRRRCSRRSSQRTCCTPCGLPCIRRRIRTRSLRRTWRSRRRRCRRNLLSFGSRRRREAPDCKRPSRSRWLVHTGSACRRSPVSDRGHTRPHRCSRRRCTDCHRRRLARCTSRSHPIQLHRRRRRSGYRPAACSSQHSECVRTRRRQARTGTQSQRPLVESRCAPTISGLQHNGIAPIRRMMRSSHVVRKRVVHLGDVLACATLAPCRPSAITCTWTATAPSAFPVPAALKTVELFTQNLQLLSHRPPHSAYYLRRHAPTRPDAAPRSPAHAH